MGTVWVDVAFGDKNNCRTESLLFEVVDLESPYHALLGRPALAKFMASTHVAYLKMKLPGKSTRFSKQNPSDHTLRWGPKYPLPLISPTTFIPFIIFQRNTPT